jgi:hypothetical protein
MSNQRKILAVALAAVLLLASAAWYYQRFTERERGSVPCAQQQAARFSPYCLAQSQAAAARGERAAMAALVAYFDSRQPAQAIRWTRAAARLGEPRAVSRVLSACGAAGPFAPAEAQALLPLAAPLEALDFRLGGSCVAADMAAARAFSPADLVAVADSVGLCRVAVRYGLLRMSSGGAELDSQAAQQLLAECERRPQAPLAVRQEAESVRQMLAREIKQVRISVD